MSLTELRSGSRRGAVAFGASQDSSRARGELRNKDCRDRSPSGNFDLRSFEDPDENLVQLVNSIPNNSNNSQKSASACQAFYSRRPIFFPKLLPFYRLVISPPSHDPLRVDEKREVHWDPLMMHINRTIFVHC